MADIIGNTWITKVQLCGAMRRTGVDVVNMQMRKALPLKKKNNRSGIRAADLIAWCNANQFAIDIQALGWSTADADEMGLRFRLPPIPGALPLAGRGTEAEEDPDDEGVTSGAEPDRDAEGMETKSGAERRLKIADADIKEAKLLVMSQSFIPWGMLPKRAAEIAHLYKTRFNALPDRAAREVHGLATVHEVREMLAEIVDEILVSIANEDVAPAKPAVTVPDEDTD